MSVNKQLNIVQHNCVYKLDNIAHRWRQRKMKRNCGHSDVTILVEPQKAISSAPLTLIN